MKLSGTKFVLSSVALVLVAAALYFPVRFAMAFELFGLAVNSPVHGWLGPTPRGSKCVADIGKVNTWQCPDTAVFQQHRYGCLVWLKVFGYV